MVAKGVKTENITVSGICTCCHPEQFFSYRQANVTGRFTAVIGFQNRGSSLK
jgi:copper oxidase (laccase) domain-containing protein